MPSKPTLREVRKDKELSVAELARRTGLHPTTIFEVESGRRSPYPKCRRLLSQALETPVAVLFPQFGEEKGNEFMGEGEREIRGSVEERIR